MRGLCIGIATTTLVVMVQWLGLFTTASRAATDFLFTPTTQPSALISVVAIDDRSLRAIGRWPWPRETQATLLRVIGESRPTVIGYDIVTDDPTEEAADRLFEKTLRELGVVVTAGNDAEALVDIDGDGTVRRLPCERSFALAVAKRVADEVSCSTDRLIINYRLDPSSVEIVSATSVLGGARVRTPIVLVGITAPSLQDVRRTPLTKALLPGVFIHANAIDTLIANRTLREAPMGIKLLGTTLVVFSFTLILWRVKYVWGIVVLGGFVALAIGLTMVMYALGWRVDLWYLVAGLVVTYGSQLAAAYLVEWRRRRFVTEAFGKFVSRRVVDELIAHPQTLRLGAQARRLSLFFSDIRSFTTIAERMDPEALVELLNRFLSFATREILREDGTVDKYIGDAVVAFWNAPIGQSDHAVRAAHAAIAIRDGMARFDPLTIGIGLHTGEALVGNIGSMDRLSYTAIGDAVNTASRLEGITKMYGVSIVVSRSFYEEACRSDQGAFVFRTLDTVIVKGKTTPVVIYELCGRGGSHSLQLRAKIRAYEEALRLYRRGAFDKALTQLTQPILGDDGPATVIAQRCRQFVKHPPASWNGTTVLVSK